MPTKSKSLMLTVPEDIAAAAADMKQKQFMNKSYAELYRYLIRRGLDSLKTEPPPMEDPR